MIRFLLTLLLNAIMPRKKKQFDPPKKEKDVVIWPSDEHRRTFLRCLGKSKTHCRIWREEGKIIFAIRPKDFPSFRYRINQTALEKCEFTARLIRHVETMPMEFIRIEYTRN
jgi:hypothetical protein